MVFVKSSIEFTKLLIKMILEERKSCKGRSLQLVGKYYVFVEKKGNPQTLTYMHIYIEFARTYYLDYLGK